MKVLGKFILGAFLFLATLLSAAGQEGRYSVRGRVTDLTDGKPMELVSVAVPGRHLATVTNQDGEYVIKSDSPIEELRFSCLGYRSKTVSAGSPDVVLNVQLSRVNTLLPEARVVYGNAWDIVREAKSRITENYPSEPELLDCFYRETIQKRSRYTSVTEAVARLYKNSYGRGVYADRAALEKSRSLLSQKRTDTLSVKMTGGPTQALIMDAVKNPEVFLSEDFLGKYYFTMEPVEYIDDRPQYVVRMHPGAVTEYPLYYGTLYIDRETLAFTRLELSLDMSDKGAATRMMLVRKPAGLRFTPKEMSLTLSYRPMGGRMRLSYFRSTLRFNCDWKKRLFSTPYNVVNELVVTDKRPQAVPIPKSEMFSTRDFLIEKSAEFSDPDFWEDYNIIEPSESLEHAIGRLRRR